MDGVRTAMAAEAHGVPDNEYVPRSDAGVARPKHARDWRRFAVRAAIAACATILVTMSVSYVMLLWDGSVRIQQSDFLVYYSAMHLAFHGHGGAIYDFSTLKSVEASVFHSSLQIRKEAVFLYPPFIALVFAPLAALGYGPAYFIWVMLNCVLLAGTIAAFRRYLCLGTTGTIFLAVAGASFFPVFASLAQGQVSIVLLSILTTTFLLFRSGHEGWAGGILALALIKPPYVLPFLLLLLVQRRWRALAVFSAVAGLLALVPTVIFGSDINQAYVHVLKVAAGWHTTSGGFSARANQNLAGFFRLLFATPLATVLQYGASATVLLCVALIAYRDRTIDLAYAAATVAALLLNPHVLIHDLSLLVIPAVIAVRHHKAREIGLPLLLTGGYVLILIGMAVSARSPIQLSVLAMAAMLVWLFRARVLSTAINNASHYQIEDPRSTVSHR